MNDPRVWIAWAIAAVLAALAVMINYAALSVGDHVNVWVRRASIASGLIGLGLLVLLPIAFLFAIATMGAVIDTVVWLFKAATVFASMSLLLVGWSWASTRSKA